MDGLQHLTEELKSIREKLDIIAIAVIGDPSDPNKPGVLIRLDRLEQSNIQKTKIFWILASGVAAAFGATLLQWLR